jgi:hypothetical protein
LELQLERLDFWNSRASRDARTIAFSAYYSPREREEANRSFQFALCRDMPHKRGIRMFERNAAFRAQCRLRTGDSILR